MRFLFALLLCLWASAVSAQGFGADGFPQYKTSSGGGGGGGTSVAFTPLHIYFMSPTGSDAANGLTPATAWFSPQHAVVCGDVIIAQAGTYDNNFQYWGAVSNCPSTTGGIDGAGGIYFATVLCAGPNIESCKLSPAAGNGEATRVDMSNWAVEGFRATTTTNTCFSSTSEDATVKHHIAFINNIAVNCASSGFNSYSWNGPTSGVDQTAVVGAVAYNAASSSASGNCTSGISLIPSNGPDASAGTHVFVAGYFGYKNINGAGCDSPGATTDGNGIIFDSWACDLYTRQGVIEQSVVWANGSTGIEVFPNCTNADDKSQTHIRSTTSYGNFQDPFHTGIANGELLFLNNTKNTGAVRSVQGSIFQATMATPGGAALSGAFGNQVFAAGTAFTNTATSADLDVSGNYIWNSHAPTSTTTGSPNTLTYNNGLNIDPSFPWGTNTYNNANFAAPGTLPSTAPSCAAYTNTTDCMVAAGVPAALTPSGGAAALGYKVPGPCAADPLFPAWLKGVVYLKASGYVSGATITMNSGLITKPCGV